MLVFYVTGTHVHAGIDPRTGQRVRSDLGKFFAESHAAEHAAAVDPSWFKLAVESREEDEAERHPLHRP